MFRHVFLIDMFSVVVYNDSKYITEGRCSALPKVTIIEDNAEHARSLAGLLAAHQKLYPDCVFEIRQYSNPLKFLNEYACDADLIFLDIQMPEMDGMSAAHRIRAIDPKVMLIFTTALAQYAIAGYEVQAFDYILKPLTPDMFEAKLTRALRVLNYRQEEEWIDVSTKTETRRIAVNQVTYIEVNNHDILIHTPQQTYRHWGSLKEYEQKLAALHFMRCNTCYLVNMKHVNCISGDDVTVGADRLAISRSRRKGFLMAFAKYKGGSQ